MGKAPSTQATRLLRQHGIPYREHLYRYEDRGGTATAARELGIDEHLAVKTLIFEDDSARPFVVLMHGDREVSARALARQIGARSVQICRPETAQKHSGYLVGGTSPFGTRKAMPVYVEKSVLALDRIYVNGGSRGFLVEMAPEALTQILKAVPVEVALGDGAE